jgi:tetratricopeptide (TPR) repeat protein
LNPDNAEALNYLGYTYADHGIFLEEAEELVSKAARLRPEDGYIVDSLGWVYFKQGRFPEAARELERAGSLVPDDPVILEHLGDAYRQLGQGARALEVYRKALEKAKEEDRNRIDEKIRALEKRK